MWWLLVGAALASDSEFAGTEEPGSTEEEEVDTDLSLELGGMWTLGNTDNRTLTVRYDGSQRWDQHKVSTKGGSITGSSLVDSNTDGRLDESERATGRVETAHRQEGWLRYDRYLGDRDSFYGLAGGFSDPYAGYDSRFNVQVGYSYLLVDREGDNGPRVIGELGFDGAREDIVGAAADPDIVYSARALLSLELTFEETISFGEQVESLVSVQDPEDTRVNSETSLTAKLSDICAVKLSYRVNFDTQPVEGFAKTDQTGLVTVITSIF